MSELSGITACFMSELSVVPTIFMSEVLSTHFAVSHWRRDCGQARYRFAAATRFTISATVLYFFRITGRFANLAGIFPLCFTHGTFSEMARMDTYVRFVPFPY